MSLIILNNKFEFERYKYIFPKESINKLCPSGKALVYRFDHCLSTSAAEGLEETGIETYEFQVGDNETSQFVDLCKEEKIHQIDAGIKDSISKLSSILLNNKNSDVSLGQQIGSLYTISEDFLSDPEISDLYHLIMKRKCKAALVNIVLKNYKLQQKGKEKIPIIFCIDNTNNPFPLTSENALSKIKYIEIGEDLFEANGLITHSEIRRAFKLCNDEQIDARIRMIAKSSFIFTKLLENKKETIIINTITIYPLLIPAGKDISDRVEEIRNSKPEFKHSSFHLKTIDTVVNSDFEIISTPWQKNDWSEHWIARKEMSDQNPPIKTHDWRKQVNEFVVAQTQDVNKN